MLYVTSQKHKISWAIATIHCTSETNQICPEATDSAKSEKVGVILNKRL